VTIERRSDIRSLLEANTVKLPDGILVTEVAARCRGAVLMLLESEHTPWGKPELAQWLAGPYRSTTCFATARPLGIPAASRRMPIRVERLDGLLAEARGEVRSALERVAQSTDISFSYDAVEGGFIERCQDETGAKGWLPRDRVGIGLSLRALSLLAVDYLVRPADYLGLISVCEDCGRVSFDAVCRAQQRCHEHRLRPSVAPPAPKLSAG
jgi:hypothetical protein